ncbi:MAG: nickel pincer cofactor biosynthesis protein LarC [Lawsonibacter sp.]|nr:nickel pincer cofactor biosynthesis protein LarC [Lawsonibacter sp.]
MKTLYLECKMGAAGDMLMAALYELLGEGQRKEFLDTMNGLGLPGVEVAPVAAKTSGIAGTHMRVTVHGHEEHDHDHHDHDHHEHEHHHHHHATPGHIGAIIDGLSLPREVREKARQVYDAIAQAEAQAHGCDVGDVHYHEVGALDAVADVVGVCYAMYLLNPDLVTASPVHVGSGTVKCAHGIMPVPAPATAALLKGIPIYSGAVQGELCTPTGAALLKTFVQSFGPMSEMDVEKIGYGIGTKEFPPQANCVRAFWGEEEPQERGDIVELACNIDDMTPEALAFACQRLLEAGALDVYTTPGTMKKGRPGWVLTVLCDPYLENDIIRQIFTHTSTNGLRSHLSMKYFLKPRQEQVQTQWGPVGVKLAQGFGVTHVKPEFEDAAALARTRNLPYRAVFEDAIRNFKED